MLTLRVNGDLVTVGERTGETTLLDFLRARGLTGAKEGCAEGECGACAVALVSACGAGSAYRVINSCLMPLPLAAGREVYTVEGLADAGTLADAQIADKRARVNRLLEARQNRLSAALLFFFIDHHAASCDFAPHKNVFGAAQVGK